VLLEAVIGVVGVLGIVLVGGGETLSLSLSDEAACSWSAAILAAVGVLRGFSVRGGSRRGCRVFLAGAAIGLVSKSSLDV